MKTEENKDYENTTLVSLSEEQIIFFASQLRKKYEFLEVEESKVFVKELSELMKEFI